MVGFRILALVSLSFSCGFGKQVVEDDRTNGNQGGCTGVIEAFNNTDKRNPEYVLQPNETSLSDNNIQFQSWIGEPGVALYAGPDPGANHCGTNNPIYGRNVTEVSTYLTHLTACVHSVQSPACEYQLPIQAIFCENLGHHIYQIYPEFPADSAFCVVPYNSQLNYITNIAVTVPIPIEEGGQLNYRFLCEFNLSTTDNFWYTVKWYRDGTLIKTHPPSFHSNDIAQTTLLLESMLGTNSLGFKIQCSYAVSLQEDSETGYDRRSPEKFIGIEILNPTINIGDGQQTGIQIRSTVPLGCLSTEPNCALMVNIMDPTASQSNPSCDLTNSFSNCGIKIPSDQWNQVFNVTISADPATQYGNKLTVNTISLTTSANFPSHGIWQNYNIGIVEIRNSQDTSKIEGSCCSATCDPHMRSFGATNGKRFEHQYKGLFTMYQNIEWKQEVQIQTSQCSKYRDDAPYCVCGVAIRVGREVFVIDHCAPLKYWQIAYTQCSDTNAALMEITRSGSNYRIKLPSGLLIETRTFTYNNLLNLYLYPSEADVTAEGLCGAVGSDLFNKRDGTPVTYQSYPGMPDFSNSWRVEAGIKNLFTDDIKTLSDLATGGFFCQCTTPEGSTEPQFTCEKTSDACAASLGNSQPVKACQVGDLVVKRSAPNNRFVRSVRPQHSIKKRAAMTWRDGWDQAKAEAYCDSVYSNSTLMQKCRQIPNNIDLDGPRDNCIRDIEYMADTSFALVYIEAIASECEREVVYNPTFHTAAVGQTSILDQIKMVLCPLDCSYRGSCANGRCICDSGWSGLDCSFDLSIIPLVDHVDKLGQCDLLKEKCSDISVFGGNFIDASTRCRIVEQQLSEAGDYGDKTERDELSTVESIGEAKCKLSVPSRKRRSVTKPTDEFVQVYSIAVSNNGAAYSNSSLVVVFNSQCQFCTISNGDVQCQYTGYECFSGGRCYGKGEPHLVHKCYTCSINNGVREWILKKDDDECNLNDEDLVWIAGVVVGVLVLVAMVVGLVYCLIKKKKSKVSSLGSPPPYSTTGQKI